MTVLNHFLSFTLLVTISLVIGCGTSTTPTPPNAALPPADAKGSEAANSSDITEAEALEFAKAWEKCLQEVDTGAAYELVSWRGMIDRTLEPFSVSEKFRKGFVKGALDNFSSSIVKQMANMLQDGGSYNMVRTLSRGGKRHVVFRLIQTEAGLNYHDFQLERVNGKVRASHLYIAATGEEMADTIRTLAAPLIVSANSTLGKINGDQKRELKTIEDISKLHAAVKAGNRPQVAKIYKSLPEKTRNNKIVQLSYIMSLDIDNNEAEYVKGLENYARLYPGDPSLGLQTLDIAYLKQDIPMLMNSHKLIQDWTGGDPYLDLMIGCLLADLGKVDEAVKLTKNADPSKVGTAEAHDYKLTIALAIKDHAMVLKQLLVLRNQFEYEVDDLDGVEGFEDFVLSPEYKQLRGKPFAPDQSTD